MSRNAGRNGQCACYWCKLEISLDEFLLAVYPDREMIIQDETNLARRLPAGLISFLGLIVFCPAPSSGYSIEPTHPRIYLTQTTIDSFRYRCLDISPMKEEYEEVKTWVDGCGQPSGNEYVFASEVLVILMTYVVEDGNPTYLSKAKAWLNRLRDQGVSGDKWTLGLRLRALSLGYDWLYHDLSRQERASYAAAVVQIADYLKSAPRFTSTANQYSDYSNIFYWHFSYIMFAGIALDGESGFADKASEYLDCMEAELKNHMIPATNQVAGSNGGWHEGLGDYTSMTSCPFAHIVEAWRTAAGENLFSHSSFLEFLPQFLFYCRRPHDGNYVEIGDIELPATWNAANVMAEGDLMPLVEARYQNGFAKYICNQILPHPSYKFNNWAYLLWYDPGVADLDADTIPISMCFDGVGYAVVRTGWDEDAAFALLRAGIWYSGHQHDDQGSIILHRKGTLATEGGEYGYDDAIYHNTLLIGGSQTHYARNRVQFWQEMEGTEYDLGGITAFESGDCYTYVVCDIGRAYDSHKVDYFQREFVCAGSDCFVVFDRVRSRSVAHEKRFLLNCLNAPLIESGVVRISDGEGVLLCSTVLPKNAAMKYQRNDVGRYRVEIEPSVRQADDHFLHVLYLCDDIHSQFPSVEGVDAGNMLGVYVGGDRLLLFGSAPGRIDTVLYPVGGTDSVTHLLFNMYPNTDYRVYCDGAGIVVTTGVLDGLPTKEVVSTFHGGLSFRLPSRTMRTDVDSAIEEDREGNRGGEEVKMCAGGYLDEE